MPRVSSVPINKGEHPIPVYASAMRSAQAPMVPCTRGRRLLPSTASADSLGFLSDPGWAGLPELRRPWAGPTRGSPPDCGGRSAAFAETGPSRGCERRCPRRVLISYLSSRARRIDSHQDGASTISLPHPFLPVLLRAMVCSRRPRALAPAMSIRAIPSRSTSPRLDGLPSPP